MKLLIRIVNPICLSIKKRRPGSSGNGDKLAPMIRNEVNAQSP